MSRPRTTQDLYGDAFKRIEGMHDSVRKFRAQATRVKDVFQDPVGSCCILSPVIEPEGEEQDVTDDDRRAQYATPKPVVEAGLEEFRLALNALRSITL